MEMSKIVWADEQRAFLWSNRIVNETEEEMVIASTEEETMMAVEEMGMAPKEAEIPMAVDEEEAMAVAEE